MNVASNIAQLLSSPHRQPTSKMAATNIMKASSQPLTFSYRPIISIITTQKQQIQFSRMFIYLIKLNLVIILVMFVIIFVCILHNLKQHQVCALYTSRAAQLGWSCSNNIHNVSTSTTITQLLHIHNCTTILINFFKHFKILRHTSFKNAICTL